MLENILVVIPARKGSKGLMNKNTKLLLNRPLIEYTILYAKSIFPVHNICVSTDDEKILSIADKLGVPARFKRPDNLSTDESSTQDVLLHALDFWEKNYHPIHTVVLLQPTSPLRKKYFFLNAFSLYNKDIDMVVSVFETKANPYFVLFEQNSNGYIQKSKNGNFTRRQDCPKVYEYNGSIYIINATSLKAQRIHEFSKVIKYEMPDLYSVDIDNLIDIEWAEFLLRGEKVFLDFLI